MSARMITIALLVIFVGAALSGVYLSAPLHHGEGCPLMADFPALCSMAFEQVSQWQQLFLATLVSLVVLAAAVALTRLSIRLSLLRFARAPIPRTYQVPRQPLLLQELYSQGILNRKAP